MTSRQPGAVEVEYGASRAVRSIDSLPTGHAGGHVYVVLFSTGVVKIGRTSTPTALMRGYIKKSAIYGVCVERAWVSDHLFDSHACEAAFLSWANDRGTQRMGGTEYFDGVDFDDAVKHGACFRRNEYGEPWRSLMTLRPDDLLHLETLVRILGLPDCSTAESVQALKRLRHRGDDFNLPVTMLSDAQDGYVLAEDFVPVVQRLAGVGLLALARQEDEETL